MEQLGRLRIHRCCIIGWWLFRKSMTEGALMFVHNCTGKKISLVRGHRRLENALLLDMCVQGHVCELLLKRHGWILRGDGRHTLGKIEEKTTRQNRSGQKKTDYDALYHLSLMLITGFKPSRSHSADWSDVNPTADIVLSVRRSDPFSTSGRGPCNRKGARNSR